MGNCLVTKLKGSVDADLLKLGEMRIKCSTAACGGTTTEGMRTIGIGSVGQFVVTAGGRTFKAKATGDWQEVIEWTSQTEAENQFIFPDGEYEVSILGKYFISGLGQPSTLVPSPFFSINLGDLEFSDKLWYLYSVRYGLTGELKSFDLTTHHTVGNNIRITNYFSPVSTNVIVDIDKLFANGCPELRALQLYETTRQAGTPHYPKHSRGSINNISSPNLDTLLINGTEITGDIDTMIQNMIAAGRTSGYFDTQGNNYITVKGVPFNTYRESLPGTVPNVRFTIDPTAPDGWTATRE